MASVREVARRAGVSIATVSYAFSGTRPVGEETRRRVLAAAEQLGYVHGSSSRGPRPANALVLGHLLSHLSRNAFYARVAHAVERRAAEIGYLVLLAAGEGPALARGRMRALLARGVDGVIVTTAPDVESVEIARRAGVPVVVVERNAGVDGVGFVGIDQRAGSRAITDALLDLGHRSLAFLGIRPLNGPYHDVDRDRVAGFDEALAARGLEPVAVKLLSRPTGNVRPSPDHLAAAAEVLDASGRATAVVTGADYLGMALLQVAYERGIRVPDQLSVTGFDDTIGSYAVPPLTSVAIPFDEVGRAAVDLLADLIAGERRPEEARVVLSTSISWRRSVAAPPAVSAARSA
jgi:LacI family transcriptional regulator